MLVVLHQKLKHPERRYMNHRHFYSIIRVFSATVDVLKILRMQILFSTEGQKEDSLKM